MMPQLARAEALAHVDAALAAAAASQAQLLVVADDTAHLTSMRHDLLQLARARACAACGAVACPCELSLLPRVAMAGCAAYVQLYVRAPPDLARARNEGRGSAERIPEEVFARMVASFEPPDESVREFEQNTVVVDAADDLDAAAVWHRVKNAWGEAPESPPTLQELQQQRADGQAANLASWMHAWDVGSRRAVSEAVTQGACSALRRVFAAAR